MKKSNDTNIFISEEVKKSLENLSNNCSDSKIIVLIVNNSFIKASTCKLNIILCIETLVLKNGSGILQVKEFDKIVIILSNYLSDSSVEVRGYAKKVC